MIAAHVGREAEITALGRTWKVSRWTRAVWADFLIWARPRIPDPLDLLLIVLDRIPKHLQDGAVRYAIDKAAEHVSIGSAEIQRCLASMEGTTHVLYLLLRKNHPEIDEDDAFEIAMAAGPEQITAAFDKAAGRFTAGPSPNGRGAEVDGPQAARPTGPETTAPFARTTA